MQEWVRHLDVENNKYGATNHWHYLLGHIAKDKTPVPGYIVEVHAQMKKEGNQSGGGIDTDKVSPYILRLVIPYWSAHTFCGRVSTSTAYIILSVTVMYLDRMIVRWRTTWLVSIQSSPAMWRLSWSKDKLTGEMASLPE